jgi:sec-independent protein translocase protein TatB
MLDLGWPEMLVIAIILIVVVGPKDLPKMLRAFGRTTSKVRAMAGDFRKQFDDAMKEAELDEIKNLASEARKLNPASELKKALSPMEKAARDVKSGLDQAMNPTKPASAEPADAGATPAAPGSAGAAPVEGKPSSRPLPEPAGAQRARATAAAAQSKARPPVAKEAAKPASKPAAKKAEAPAKSASGQKRPSRAAAGSGNAAKAGTSTSGKKT